MAKIIKLLEFLVSKKWNASVTHDAIWKDICQEYNMIPTNFNNEFIWESKIPVFHDIFRRSFTMIKNWKRFKCKRFELKYHQGPVLCMLMTHYTRLFTGDIGGIIHVWDVQNGAYVTSIQAHRTNVSCFANHQNLIASGSEDTEINIFRINDFAHVANLKGHKEPVISLAFSKNEEGILFSGSADTTIRIWDTTNGQCLRVLHGQDSMISSLIFCPYIPKNFCRFDVETEMVDHNKAGYLISGSSAQNVFLWDLGGSARTEYPEVMSSLLQTNGAVSAMALYDEFDESNDGDYSNEYIDSKKPLNIPTFVAVAGCLDSGVSVFSLPRLERTYVEGPITHIGTIWSISVATIHSKLVTASGDSKAMVWDFRNRSNCLTLGGFDSAILASSISPQEEAMCFGTEKGTIVILDMQEFA